MEIPETLYLIEHAKLWLDLQAAKLTGDTARESELSATEGILRLRLSGQHLFWISGIACDLCNFAMKEDALNHGGKSPRQA